MDAVNREVLIKLRYIADDGNAAMFRKQADGLRAADSDGVKSATDAAAKRTSIYEDAGNDSIQRERRHARQRVEIHRGANSEIASGIEKLGKDAEGRLDKSFDAAKNDVDKWMKNLDDSLARSAAKRQREFDDAFSKARDGVESLARSFVYMGIASEDSMDKAIRTLARFEGIVKGIKGGIDSVSAVNDFLKMGPRAIATGFAGHVTANPAAIGATAAAGTAMAGFLGLFAWASPQLRRELGEMIGIFHDSADKAKRAQAEQFRAAAHADYLQQRQGVLSLGADQIRSTQIEHAYLRGSSGLSGVHAHVAGTTWQVLEAESMLKSLKQQAAVLRFQIAEPFHAFGSGMSEESRTKRREGVKEAQSNLQVNEGQQKKWQEQLVQSKREQIKAEEQRHAAAMAGLLKEKGIIDEQTRGYQQQTRELMVRGLQLKGDIESKKVAFALMDPLQQMRLKGIQAKIDRGEELTHEDAVDAHNAGFGALGEAGKNRLIKSADQGGVAGLLGKEHGEEAENQAATNRAIDAANRAEDQSIENAQQQARAEKSRNARRGQTAADIAGNEGGRFTLGGQIELINKIQLTVSDDRSRLAQNLTSELEHLLDRREEVIQKYVREEIAKMKFKMDTNWQNYRGAERAARG